MIFSQKSKHKIKRSHCKVSAHTGAEGNEEAEKQAIDRISPTHYYLCKN